jgi:hypothetical protein
MATTEPSSLTLSVSPGRAHSFTGRSLSHADARKAHARLVTRLHAAKTSHARRIARAIHSTQHTHTHTHSHSTFTLALTQHNHTHTFASGAGRARRPPDPRSRGHAAARYALLARYAMGPLEVTHSHITSSEVDIYLALAASVGRTQGQYTAWMGALSRILLCPEKSAPGKSAPGT